MLGCMDHLSSMCTSVSTDPFRNITPPPTEARPEPHGLTPAGYFNSFFLSFLSGILSSVLAAPSQARGLHSTVLHTTGTRHRDYCQSSPLRVSFAS
jgi:hypothetical protein